MLFDERMNEEEIINATSNTVHSSVTITNSRESQLIEDSVPEFNIKHKSTKQVKFYELNLYRQSIKDGSLDSDIGRQILYNTTKEGIEAMGFDNFSTDFNVYSKRRSDQPRSLDESTDLLGPSEQM